MMNDLSAKEATERSGTGSRAIPRAAICIVVPLLLAGLAVSLFILVEVHNPVFFLSLLSLSSLVAAFIIWNSLSFHYHCRPRNSALSLFVRSVPLSDLRVARPGHLVKLSGPVSCGNVPLESSYEKVGRCVYTSTLLYEYRGFGLEAFSVIAPSFLWKLAYTERFSTDFYISDRNSGIQALVKAGYGCKVTPLIVESKIVNTRINRIHSPNLTRWLKDRNLSAEHRLIRLEEGYIQEGNCITVVGMLCKGDEDILMVVQPPELISTGCLWQRLLLPLDFDGLILGPSSVTRPISATNS